MGYVDFELVSSSAKREDVTYITHSPNITHTMNTHTQIREEEGFIRKLYTSKEEAEVRFIFPDEDGT